MATPTPIFVGRVDTAGRVRLNDIGLFYRWTRTLTEQVIEVVVRKRRTRRTLDQNAYIHAVPIPMLADHFGNTIPEMKLALMGECWGWKRDPATGKELPIKPHTSEMDVEECTHFIEWVIPWAATEHQFVIPYPSEVEAA